jgi:hypothetical protein
VEERHTQVSWTAGIVTSPDGHGDAEENESGDKAQVLREKRVQSIRGR